MTALQTKFDTTRNELAASLIERDSEISLAMTALLCHEHCLFVGSPGTAKSLLCDSLVSWIDGNSFTHLMNRFTQPDEIFGPVSISGLKADEYRRITDNMLPEAHVAFLDEVFKASSAILNTTLKILNERQFQNGTTLIDCPLLLCVAASNEWPTEAKELGALFDRFLFRKAVHSVASEANIERLMFAVDLTPTLTTTLTLPELATAQGECLTTPWSDRAKVAANEIRQRVSREGIVIGDRRLRKSVTACQAYAWLNGNTEVTTDDLELLSHIWWATPETQPDTVADIVSEVAKPSGLMAAQFLSEAQQIFSGTDVSDLSKAAEASKKLQDILADCEKQCSGSRAVAAKQRIGDMIKEIRVKTVEAF